MRRLKLQGTNLGLEAVRSRDYGIRSGGNRELVLSRRVGSRFGDDGAERGFDADNGSGKRVSRLIRNGSAQRSRLGPQGDVQRSDGPGVNRYRYGLGNESGKRNREIISSRYQIGKAVRPPVPLVWLTGT